jgi:hypothetical protein
VLDHIFCGRRATDFSEKLDGLPKLGPGALTVEILLLDRFGDNTEV